MPTPNTGKVKNAVTNMIRSHPKELTVGLGEKENLKEDVTKNSVDFFCCLLLAPSHAQRNSTETVENWAKRVGVMRGQQLMDLSSHQNKDGDTH